jgi:hypothetical protein
MSMPRERDFRGLPAPIVVGIRAAARQRRAIYDLSGTRALSIAPRRVIRTIYFVPTARCGARGRAADQCAFRSEALPPPSITVVFSFPLDAR